MFRQFFDVYTSLKSLMLISVTQEQFPYYRKIRNCRQPSIIILSIINAYSIHNL